MGREIRLEYDDNITNAEILNSGAKKALIKTGDATFECELVHRSGNQIVLRVGSKMVTLYELERGVYVAGHQTIRLSDGVSGADSAAGGKGAGSIRAVMPGLVIKVAVREGQQVDAGTPLLVLEAMKMENEVKSKGSGTVKKIHVKPGEVVESGALLVEIE